MRKCLVKFALWAGVVSLVFSGAATAAEIRIGVIDTQKILRESKAARNARSIFFKDLEAKRALLIVKEKEVRAMEEEFKKEGGKISPSIRQEDGEKLRKEVKELKRLRSDLEEELKRKDRELTRKLIQEIREITRTLTKKEKYTIILEKKSVVSFDEAIDITDKIIRMYDAQKK